MKRMSAKIWMASSMVAAAMFAGCAARPRPVENLATPNTDAATVTNDSVARLSAAADEPAGTAAGATTQPALPAGHPAIGGAGRAGGAGGAGGAPQLPTGHPAISKMAPPAAAGRATMPPGTSLPAGHPDISQAQPATTQPAAIGSLSVRAVQGTKGAPAIVDGDVVAVEVYENNRIAGSITGKLDARGAVTIKGVPVSPRHQALVKVTHAGVDYSVVTDPGDPNNPNLQVNVPVFEATDQAPAWSVQMQHMIVQAVDGGVQVMEVLAIENPNDRAWVGSKGAGAEKPVTFTLTLPAGASDVSLIGGFNDAGTTVKDGKIINAAALVPGVTRYQLAYVVPSEKGVSRLTSVAPALVRHLMVIVPDDGTKVSGEGIDGPKTTNMGNGSTRYFAATDVPAGKEVSVTISGTPVPTKTSGATGNRPTAAAMAFAAADSAGITKAIAGVGALLILLFGGAFLLIKSPRTAKVKTSR